MVLRVRESVRKEMHVSVRVCVRASRYVFGGTNGEEFFGDMWQLHFDRMVHPSASLLHGLTCSPHFTPSSRANVPLALLVSHPPHIANSCHLIDL